MRCITRRIDYESRADEFRILFIGDTHLGNAGCDESTLRKLAERARTEPNTYLIGLGDYCDYINMRDPRFDPGELAPWLYADYGDSLRDIARAETDKFLSIMHDTGDKWLALCAGNHEDAIAHHSECDVYSRIIDAFAAPRGSKIQHRLDHRGFLALQFKRQGGSTWTLRMHLTHGSNGGRKPGSTANRLDDLAKAVDNIDVMAQGHTHKAMHLPTAKYRIGRRGVETVTIHAINIPPLCSDMRYADSKDMAAVSTGWTELVVVPDKETIGVQTIVS
jgi:predicted phosphodiesterase